ncbi:MBL fold metallo-hydrolase, partial [Aeromonas hydrophila]|uniref:MBL fold metallo-hydrolase n=2 Tax=Aeromonas hydrophila TaxID=644 RepID=UPI0035B8E735
MLKVNFVGAVNGVSGSCSWLHHTDSNIQFLVDCGAYQGGDEPQRVEKLEDFPFDADQISFILLTHAHLDHCGLIPTLIEYGFTGKVYATKATKATK